MTDDVLRLARESTAVLLMQLGDRMDSQPTHLRPEKDFCSSARV